MPQITIRNLYNKEIPVVDSTKSILQNLQMAYQDWMHACGGKGRCTTCKMRILVGWHNLSPFTKAELKYQHAGRLKSNERLACQCFTTGDLVVEVPDSNKLPHLDYSE